MIKRLRAKFVMINMIIVSVMLLVIFGLIFFFTQGNFRLQSGRAMDMAVEHRELPKHPSLPEEKFERISSPYMTVCVLPDGTMTLANEEKAFLEESQWQALAQKALEAEAPVGAFREQALRYERFNTPEGIRIVLMDITGEIETLRGLVISSVVIGVLAFGVFLIISIVLARCVVHPVENAWEEQRQFLADASHELKTPLAVVRTNAELLLDSDVRESERQRLTEGILELSCHMGDLVGNLLELARMDSGTLKLEFAIFDLTELVREQVLLFEPVYYERENLFLEMELEPDICVEGSRRHIRQVLDILLDNGVKYSTAEGKVSVTLRRHGACCLLSVFTPGVPLTKQQRKDIFKRFYRVDKARSRTGSYGLGLSIAEGFVKNHGGRIWAESREAGNTFHVLLPLEQ